MTTMKDDMISRQAALDALGEEPPVWYDGDDEIAERNQWRRDVAAIKALPTAQPKKGRWISADAMFHGVPFYCSECGENTRDTVMGKPRWKYCPMCGSYNGGEKDDSV